MRFKYGNFASFKAPKFATIESADGTQYIEFIFFFHLEILLILQEKKNTFLE